MKLHERRVIAHNRQVERGELFDFDVAEELVKTAFPEIKTNGESLYFNLLSDRDVCISYNPFEPNPHNDKTLITYMIKISNFPDTLDQWEGQDIEELERDLEELKLVLETEYDYTGPQQVNEGIVRRNKRKPVRGYAERKRLQSRKHLTY